ncbi:AAA family ATPase [Shewanella psychrotolerans]|uniref:AAA family ATPase n=1 Tax=Shewanella psychrotolerans TaxID=2864206 RepID=UPI001C661967|nr:AAA family ATPase [Shewanella psychrotolerans]QYK01611.1 AAA family ATPase [Shewanella psychrotolerans]
MTFQASILLPSQESLLHRLQHVVLYGQQLTVLTGDEGAGKTTIVTALVDELEGVSSALVTCPQHAESAEIRRKILVQLLSDPLFDDEVTLPETLVELSDSLPTSSHIVIDDAHYLPLEVWAECIILSQMLLTGKSISLTLTAPSSFLSELLTQLPESQHQLLLPMAIEPLPDVEREALYYSLLHRSEQTPFTPRDIVRDQLQQQQGLPSEVVTLLYLALHGKPEKVKSSPWLLFSIVTITLFFIALVGYFIIADDDSSHFTPEQTVSSVRASQDNYAYGEALLFPYFSQRQQWAIIEPVGVEAIDIDNKSEVDGNADLALNDAANKQQGLDKPSNKNASVINEENRADNVEVFAVTASELPTEKASQLGVVEDKPSTSVSVEHPSSGYTLQLASVKKLESLDEIIDKLESTKEMQVARYKQRWVILYGQYESQEQARNEAKRLQQEMGLQLPWLRMWADLSQYQLQQELPNREIQ